jgi:predicted kinase
MKNLWVLIGPPCCGKSYLAAELWFDNKPGTTEVISQDKQGKEHFQFFLKYLSDGKQNIIIDRMNFNVMQRCRYALPADYLGYNIIYVVFNMTPELSYTKCLTRENHPTIKTPENASSAVNCFFNQWEAPDEREPYDKMVII